MNIPTTGSLAKALTFVAVFGSTLVAMAGVGDQFGKAEIHQPDKVQPGRIAFVDTSLAKLIELDLTGKVTWEYAIPFALAARGRLSAGTDVEWLQESDHFLLAIPESGVFEINRKGDVVWQYKTRFVDHDADRLSNGNTIFVNGWDADTDPIVTEVDPKGKIVMQLFAAQLELDPAERRSNPDERYSNTHANAVMGLADNEYLISLRNFNQFIKVKDGRVTARVKNARRVHDPSPYKEGFLFAVHLRNRSELIYERSPGQRESLFKPAPETWTPLRTVEPLRNGNILITGSREVGQLDAEGKLVWSILMDNYVAQKGDQRKKGSFIYKAAFVYK